MVFHEVFLFAEVHFRQGFELTEMRPAIFIYRLQLIIPALPEEGTDGYMHQVLLLLFGEFLPYIAEFLDSDEEQNGFHIGFLPKSLNQAGFQIPPPGLQIILCLLHLAKIVQFQVPPEWSAVNYKIADLWDNR